jgi:hypothetical protein
VIRNDLPELFDVFDFANPHLSTGARPKTTVPTQGLFMLNDTMVMNLAEGTARRVLAETSAQPPEARIDRLFQLICSRQPTTDERSSLQLFLEQKTTQLAASENPDLKALTLVCHAVFASSRFQFLE